MRRNRAFLKFGWDGGIGSFSVMLIGLILLPHVISYADLATEVICFGLLAMSFNIVFGYSGMLSFCHASLFSVGAYTIGNLIIHQNINILLGIFAAGLATVLVVIPIGLISIQRLGIYFAFLTLAFNELIHYVIYEWTSLTGGDEGLRDIFRPDLDLGLWSINISTPMRFYYFALAIFCICFVLIERIINSPFGKVLKCIRENQDRAEAIGFDIKKFKIIVFAISGFFAGVSGALHTLFIKFADVEHSTWLFSGDVVLMTLLGGIKSVFGPILGAAVFTLLSDTFSAIWDRWLFILGFIFLFCVLFFRDGIQGILNTAFRSIFVKGDFEKERKTSRTKSGG